MFEMFFAYNSTRSKGSALLLPSLALSQTSYVKGKQRLNLPINGAFGSIVISSVSIACSLRRRVVEARETASISNDIATK